MYRGQCTSRDQQCKTFVSNESNSNETSSCSDDGCMLACSGPMFADDRCYNLPQYFLDGTSCEGGGKCSNGVCEGAKLGNQILDWFKKNKNIAIPVGCVIGVLLLIAIISCCCSCRRRARSRSRRVPVQRRAPPPDMGQHPPAGWNWGGSRNGGHVPLPSQSGPPPPPYQTGPPQSPMGQPMGQGQFPGQGGDGRYEPFREQQRGYARYA